MNCGLKNWKKNKLVFLIFISIGLFYFEFFVKFYQNNANWTIFCIVCLFSWESVCIETLNVNRYEYSNKKFTGKLFMFFGIMFRLFNYINWMRAQCENLSFCTFASIFRSIRMLVSTGKGVAIPNLW